jgi:heme/copper-type cytochrome/quinol oxidase subunit 3
MAVATIDESTVTLADAPPPPPARPRMVVVATGFAVLGSFMLMASLLGIYLVERAALVEAGGTWVPQGVTIPLPQPTMMFFTLVMSSVTVTWASNAIKHDDRRNAYLAFGVTLLLGMAFVNMYAYLNSIVEIDAASAATMPVLYYTVTGAHLVLLVAAMAFLAFMAFRALGGQYSSRNRDGITGAALFWHAQVLIYAVVWYAIYIVK